MGLKKKVIDTILGLVLFFIINLAVSSLCMLFLDLTFRQCLLYSLINAAWMPYALTPVLHSIKSIEFGRKSR
jgi:hypothetical protein